VSIENDISQLKAQLEHVLSSEPPPAGVAALFFGLFDALDENEQEIIGYYVAGVTHFDPEEPDTLCNPAWFPESRYLYSRALEAIKQAELSAAEAGRADDRALLGYAGQLATAIIVSRHAADGLSQARIVVGFDSGDFVEVAA
jgi:hypothetical protein